MDPWSPLCVLCDSVVGSLASRCPWCNQVKSITFWRLAVAFLLILLVGLPLAWPARGLFDPAAWPEPFLRHPDKPPRLIEVAPNHFVEATAMPDRPSREWRMAAGK